MNILLGIQCRSGSTRFPGKCFEELGGVPLLQRIYTTCSLVNLFPKVNEYTTVVLMPGGDEKLFEFCKANKMEIFQGPEDDVVLRYWQCGKDYDATVRITGDCPVIPKSMIEDIVKLLMEVDYVTNVNPRTYVDGWDCQGISKKGLEWINEHQTKSREHPFLPLDTQPDFLKEFMDAGFTVRRLVNPERIIPNPYHPDNKWSVDTKEDLERLRKIYAKQR